MKLIFLQCIHVFVAHKHTYEHTQAHTGTHTLHTNTQAHNLLALSFQSIGMLRGAVMSSILAGLG